MSLIQFYESQPRQIVILSGKGGTGKTSTTAAFAHLASLNQSGGAVLVDADVDASNLELLLGPTPIESHDFMGGQVAVVDPVLCAECGICANVCRFDAIHNDDGITVDLLACEGCGTCTTQCPNGAIRLEPELAGRWFQSETRFGRLFHATLFPGAENSGKLVALVRQQALQFAGREKQSLVIVDGPPGVGCPVIAAVSGADLALIVAEPTAAGVHDMSRILETTTHFAVPALVCINKADIYPEGAAEIESFCHERGIPVVSKIPFDITVTEAMVQGQPITYFAPEAPSSQALREAWDQVKSVAKEKK
jgi:MinD superfamily P-loop ATPase